MGTTVSKELARDIAEFAAKIESGEAIKDRAIQVWREMVLKVQDERGQLPAPRPNPEGRDTTSGGSPTPVVED